ncbi:MAG: polyphenol oxidase family protein [Elusimicrobiaceae bacterium]|nr:polyphenol oxidase family protein [Elusimicrobiaceae bacterium]
MKIFTDPRMLQHGFIAGTLSRQEGPMNTVDRQAEIFTRLGIDPQKMLHLHQIHSDILFSFDNETRCRSFTTAPLQDGDGWIFAPAPTSWGAAIVTADCVPLFVWAEDASVWGLAHCGWRGVAAKLPLKTVQALQSRTTSPLCVWAGPHIQSCCFEVQEDTASQFPPQTRQQRGDKIFIDLNEAIRLQLLQTGLDVQFSDKCTCCQPADFFSWRRDHKREMLLSFMYKP